MSKGALILVVLAALTACDKSRDAVSKRNLCKIGALCDIASPERLNLYVSKESHAVPPSIRALLEPDITAARLVNELVPYGKNGAYPQTAKQNQQGRTVFPTKAYFVTPPANPATGVIWVVFAHVKGEPPKAQAIMDNVNLTLSDVVTDGTYGDVVGLYRIAVIDKRTGKGPTFQWNGRDKNYVRYEFDSAEIRRDWEAATKSSCGGGPLTNVPEHWEEERKRDCQSLEKAQTSRW